jgi:hypothetical protein
MSPSGAAGASCASSQLGLGSAERCFVIREVALCLSPFVRASGAQQPVHPEADRIVCFNRRSEKLNPVELVGLRFPLSSTMLAVKFAA